jgi:hypothetical protein
MNKMSKVDKIQSRIDEMEAKRARIAGEIAEVDRDRETIDSQMPALYAAAELQPSPANERAIDDAERKVVDLHKVEARKRAAISQIAGELSKAAEELRKAQIAELWDVVKADRKRAEKDADELERIPYADYEIKIAEAVDHWNEARAHLASIADLEGDGVAAGQIRSGNPFDGQPAAPYRDPRRAFEYWLVGRKGKRPVVWADWIPKTMRAAMFEQYAMPEIKPGRVLSTGPLWGAATD